MDILGVGIKGVSPNPEKEIVGWMPAQAGGYRGLCRGYIGIMEKKWKLLFRA